MNKVREVDLLNDTITVEAGCVLADIQAKAADLDRLFPLSLGIEVVLADGRVWNGLRGLRKDNTGYDLKQLFIGAEGTLGIITAAVLKLSPKPSDTVTAFLAVPDPETAAALLVRARASVGEQVTSFELIPRICIDMDLAHVPGIVDPLAERYDWYVLLEVDGQGAPGTLQGVIEDFLGEAAEAGQVLDATIAASEAQGAALWKIRDAVAEAQNHFGTSIKHDVSVPLSSVPEFISRASEALEAAYPGIRIVAFGHLGDGNIHFNPAGPVDMAGEAFAAERATINRIVHDIVAELDGSISAEHGLGRLRREEARHYKPEIEMELMERVKQALDPDNILNPGKVV
jgi:FAD/FMN-containing dehydrogenase